MLLSWLAHRRLWDRKQESVFQADNFRASARLYCVYRVGAENSPRPPQCLRPHGCHINLVPRGGERAWYTLYAHARN